MFEENTKDPVLKLGSGDEFDSALRGIVTPFGCSKPILVYSRDELINILMKRDGLSFDEAEDYVCYNIEGAYMGSYTPVLMMELPPDEIEDLVTEVEADFYEYHQG